MAALPEADLTHAVTRCQAGDKQSFRLIVNAHSERLYRIAYLVADDRSRLEDAVQEALFLAWRNIKRLRKGAKLGPWLNRILLNQIKKQGRSARHPGYSGHLVGVVAGVRRCSTIRPLMRSSR